MQSVKLRMTILGLIARQDNHAYQLEKIIEKENLREGMDIGFSTIYSTLKKLEKEGYLESYIENQESLPSRKIYSITYAGKEYLRNLLKQSIAQPKFNYLTFDVALFFSDLLPKHERKKALELYQTEIDRRIQDIIQDLTQAKPDQKRKKMILNRSLELLRAEKKWLKSLDI